MLKFRRCVWPIVLLWGTGCSDGGSMVDAGAGPDAHAARDAGELAGQDASIRVDGGADVLVNTPGPRQAHTATLLGDGRVLVIGGFGSSTSPTETWLFDPSTNAFREGPTISPRTGHRAVVLADGRVLVVGGRSGLGASATAVTSSMIFDPVTDTFTDTGSFTRLAGGGNAFLIDSGPDAGRVIVFGFSSESASFEVELFDPDDGTFTFLPGATTPLVYGPAMVKLDDGRILLAGGYLNPGNDDHVATSLLYDPATHTFSGGGTLSQPKGEMRSARLPDGKFIFLAGRDRMVTGFSESEIFDPSTDTFSLGTSWNEVSFLPTLVTLADGRILLMNGNPEATVYVYDPGTSSFSEHSRRMSQRLSIFSATLLNDGRVLTVGGQGNGGFVVGEAEIFLP